MTPEIDILQVPDAWKVVEGFPQPDWKLIGQYIRATAGEDHLKEAWHKASLQWLGVIKEKLGPGHLIFESPNFLLLSTKTKNSAIYVLNVAENALKRIRDDLKDLAWRWEHGKHAIIIIEDVDEYYHYISHFYSEEGDFATSGGIFIGSGYCHTVLALHTDYTLTLIHELTHLCVSPLQIPRWLNEGLATTTEARVVGRRASRLDDEIFERHTAYWNKQTIQDFWSGKSFRTPGEPSELSYSLAEILVDNVRTDCGPDFHPFVRDAKIEDGGEAAALQHLGASLNEVAITFLGEGDWTPALNEPQPDNESSPAT